MGGAGDDPCPGVVLYGLSAGDSCFDVLAVAAGASDGCQLGVAESRTTGGLVGAALPFNYDVQTGTVSIGTNGALGTGKVLCNAGMLSRLGSPTLFTMPSCSWQETDTATLRMTATNELDLSVISVEMGFTACSAANTPVGGECTSTWTWHMKRGLESPPSCL
jgi:hypothetical protein